MTDKPIPEGKQVYEGSCQCGAVAYTVVLNPIENASVTTCGCSICTRNGYALVYPRRDRVTWLRGYDTLKSFRFGPKRVDHKFCPECGSSVLHDPHLPDYQQFLPPGAPDVFGLNVSDWGIWV